ncbi:MFS transporter [Sphingobium sp. HBC34]|uniref:MFS transporter n=1 Tax=Sphingobium cyanobacteriorum TaxID=3063954 RepID=A0ABT8ZG09_9SPHN|nr:MFS transporter [Sphingobium sp. HBC34]MDO7833480.1 MFS transporter [Sphingobium sp. HBC34]
MQDRSGASTYLIYPGWYAVALAFLIQLIASGPIYYGFGVFGQVFEQEFQATRTSINVILTLVTLFSGFAGVPIGWLLRRFSVRSVLLVGAAGQITGLVMVAQASSFSQVLVGYGVVAGMADALLSVQLTNMLVVHWFEKRRGLAMGIAVTSTSFASVIYPPLLTGLIDALGWRATFLVVAAMLAMLMPIIAWKAGLPAQIPPVERLPRTVPATGHHAPQPRQPSVYRTADFWIVTFVVGAMFSANLAIISAVIPYARSQGLSPYAAASLLSLQGGVALLAKIGFGMIADRARLNHGLAAAGACGALSMVLWLVGGNIFVLAAAAVTFGLCLGGTLPMFGVILARRFGLNDYAMLIGASRTAMAPMMLGAPLVVGFLFDRWGSWRPTFVALLLFLLIATILSLVARFTPPPANEE